MPKLKIAPSILSADFSKINREIKQVEEYSDLIHVDIMDGIFVPPTTVNSDFVKKIKTQAPLDVHLMVHEPSDSYIQGFIDAGAASITIHQEACINPLHQIKFIKENGIKACISIKPKTQIDSIKKYLDEVDMVLIMTVEPGWAGQKFMEDVIHKVYFLRQKHPNVKIEVDGGINFENADQLIEAGADFLAVGSTIFENKNIDQAIRKLSQISAVKKTA